MIPKLSARDEAFLDLPPEPSGPKAHDTANAASGPNTQDVAETAEEGSEAPVGATGGFAGVFVYPANLDGLGQIVVLALSWWLVGLFGGLLGALARSYGSLLALLGQGMVAGYIVFFVGYCIYDSSQGGRRAPPVSLAHTPDLSDLVSQLLLLVAAVAICLWPVAVYRGVAGRADAWFWVLGAVGAFFLPMSLLTAALFDGIDALNPVLIVRSIAVTLPAYVGLLVEFGLLSGVFLGVRWTLMRVPVPQVLSTVIYLYVLLMGAHLLGRFYWRHKGRLGWGL